MIYLGFVDNTEGHPQHFRMIIIPCELSLLWNAIVKTWVKDIIKIHTNSSSPSQYPLFIHACMSSLTPFISHNTDYPEFSEANHFADQSGVYEIRDTHDPDHDLAMRQVIPTYPIIRCIPADPNLTVSYIGNYNW